MAIWPFLAAIGKAAATVGSNAVKGAQAVDAVIGKGATMAANSNIGKAAINGYHNAENVYNGIQGSNLMKGFKAVNGGMNFLDGISGNPRGGGSFESPMLSSFNNQQMFDKNEGIKRVLPLLSQVRR